MKFTMSFNMDNAAFENYPELETARILEKTAIKIQKGVVFGDVIDTNGNIIGEWAFSEDPGE